LVEIKGRHGAFLRSLKIFFSVSDLGMQFAPSGNRQGNGFLSFGLSTIMAFGLGGGFPRGYLSRIFFNVMGGPSTATPKLASGARETGPSFS
jgi:hypothetical protein